MNRTFQLFQLLIVVFGFYAAMKYSGNAKLIVSLSSIVLVIVLDRMESFFEMSNRNALTLKKQRQAPTNKIDKLDKALDLLRNSKNNLVLIDAVQVLFRDIGLPVGSCQEHPMVDRVVKVDNQAMQIAVKVVANVDDLTKEWENMDHADGFLNGEGGRLRLLLIVNVRDKQSQTTEHEFEKIPVHIAKFLTKHHTVAVTTQTVAEIYQLCKGMDQAPLKVLRRIYNHPGGVFEL